MSVIVPCFRCADVIGRAVASVYEQTLRPFELILVDDCSEDGTLQALYALQQKYPDGWIKIIPLPENSGPATARNVGWDSAAGEYIAFLDADDSWHENKIKIQYGWMRCHADIALTGHTCAVVDEPGFSSASDYSESGNSIFRAISKQSLLLSNCFPTPGVMLRRQLPYRFEPGKRYTEDFLLWLEICLDGYACYFSPQALAFLYKANVGAGGLSANLWRMRKGELSTYCALRRSGRFGYFTLLLLLSGSLVKHVVRVCAVQLGRLKSQ